MRYMKKEEILRILVVFIIPLIILMPFSSAVFLGSVSVSGSDGIPNVRRGLDYTTVSVQVSDAGNGSLLSQLTFDTPHGFHQPPTSCEGGTCYFTSDTGFLTPNVYTATANYPGVASASASFVVDGDAPTTVELTVGQEKDKVKANYYVHDPEYGGTNTMTCSGINKLEFYVDGELDSTVDVSADNGTGTKVCEYEGEAELSVNTNGEHEVFIKSYDALGNFKSSIIRPFETDFTPAVISNTFSLFKDSVEMDYIRTAGGKINDIEIRFTITEESDLSLLKADLSEVGGGTDDSIYPYASGNSNNKCLFTSANNTWDCRFHVSLELSSNNPSIHVSLEDRYGIEVSQSLTGNFITDNDNATLKFLGTDVCHENVCYVNGDEVRFIAELYDKGSGFRNELVEGGRGFIFNLEDFGLGYVNAENCTQSGSDWDCYYDADLSGVSLGNGDEKEVYMYAASEDDAGNPVVEADTANGTVIVDTSAPEMYGDVVVQESVGGRTDWFQEGDNLDFIINFIEDESVILAENAFADFSNIVGDDEPDLYTNVTAEECGEGVLTEIIVNNETNETVESMVYECRWNVENVAPTGSNVFDKVTFSVSDIVGNVVEEEDYVWILTISTEENPNYFVYTAGEACESGDHCIVPPKIDRRSIDLVDFGVWVPIYIEEYLPSTEGLNTTPLMITLNGCVEENNGTHLVDDPAPDFFGDVIDKTDFLLYIKFKTGEYDDVDSVSITCDFDVVSRHGYTISNVENENVSFEIEFFSSQYDPLDDAFIKKLKDTTVLMTGWLGWIEDAERWIQNLKSLCGIGASLTNVERIFNDIDQLMFDVALVIYPFDHGIAESLWEGWHDKAYCSIKEVVKSRTLGLEFLVDEVAGKYKDKETGKEQSYLRKACSYLSCEWSAWSLFANDSKKVEKGIQDFVKDMQSPAVDWFNKIAKHNFTGTNERNDDGNETHNATCNTVSFQPTEPWTLESMGMPTMKEVIPSVDSSIYMAVAGGCLPSVLHYLSLMRETECKYMRCMAEMATMGAPFYECEAEKSKDYCKYIIGPFLNLIPNPFKYVQDVLNWVKDSIENRPLALLTQATGPACSLYQNATKEMGVGGCTTKIKFNPLVAGWKVVPYIACAAVESYEKVEDLKAMELNKAKIEDFFSYSEIEFDDGSTHVCNADDVKKLVEEMDALE